MRQLEKDMGINQFSIYASFENKANLYNLVLQRYVSKIKNNFLKPLYHEDADIDDIQSFLENFSEFLSKDHSPDSCLMVNSAIHYSMFDQSVQKTIHNFFRSIETLFKAALDNSLNKKLILQDIRTEVEAQYLLGITQSVSTINSYKNAQEMKVFINNAIQKLR